MKRRAFIILVILLSFSINAKCFTLPGSYSKKVPVVLYNPFDYIKRVADSFSFSESQDYVLHTDSIVYVYNARLGIPKKTLRKNVSDQADYFGDIIAKNDSVFYFALDPAKAYYHEILGLFENGKVRFFDTEGNTYRNLESLINSKYGNVDNYIRFKIS